MSDLTCKKCRVGFKAPASAKRVFCSRGCHDDYHRNNGKRRGKVNSSEMRAKQSISHIGDKNPRFGMKNTDEHRRKISAANKGKIGYWRGKKYTAEMVETRASKLRGRAQSQETRDKIKEANTGKKRTESQRKALSDRTTKRLQGGWLPAVCSIKGTFESKKAGEVHYRSSYELTAYKILDADPSVKLFSVESVRIQYFWDGIIRNYLPDISVLYTDGTWAIIEVKAAWQLNDARVLAKLSAAKSFCDSMNGTFSVWTEKELFHA